MNEYDREKMQKMQQDAEHRLREMQRRADRAVSGGDMPPVPNFVSVNGNRHQNNTNNRQATDKHPHSDAQNRQHGLHPQPPSGHNKTESSQNHSVKYIPPEPKATGGILSKLKGFDILKIFNFKNLKLDSDVLIIVALIFLLSTEETDELLLLALIYIML